MSHVYICARCGTSTRHFGALLDHWRALHPGVVK